ncbi:MAG: hypothetical protein WCT49_04235 [Candidatus Paceibacterota bacterium]
MEQLNSQGLDMEQARQEGVRIFPDDPIGAELVSKNILGQLTEDEEENLMRLIQEKQYSPEVNELFSRAKEHDPQVSLVEVNHGTRVRIPEDGDEQTVWTYGLGKCNATLTLSEMDDGSREGVLTHFFPDKIQEHAGELSELLSKIDKNNIKKTKTIILSLGKKNGDENALQIEKPELAEMLAAVVRSEIPDGEIEVIPYPEFHNRLSGAKDQGVLIAKIPAKANGEATFQTWLENGTLL